MTSWREPALVLQACQEVSPWVVPAISVGAALLGAAIGAGSLLLANRQQWSRELGVRWDRAKRDEYLQYLSATTALVDIYAKVLDGNEPDEELVDRTNKAFDDQHAAMDSMRLTSDPDVLVSAEKWQAAFLGWVVALGFEKGGFAATRQAWAALTDEQRSEWDAALAAAQREFINVARQALGATHLAQGSGLESSDVA